MKQVLWTVCVIFIMAALGCKDQGDASKQYAGYIKDIKMQRAQKDSLFLHGPDSPITENDLKEFSGLHYFPVNPKFVFEVHLNELPVQDTLQVLTSKGEERAAIRYAYFVFEYKEHYHKLFVYKLLDVMEKYPKHLFLPFLDKTSGKECYGGGRYLDLEENEFEEYKIDFNLAYNPLCAYGKDKYRCPIPPSENTVPLAIRAGEKKWH